MKTPIERRLDLILETDATSVSEDHQKAAADITLEIETTRRKLEDLERQLSHAVDRLCGGLALGVRQFRPGLSVGIDRGMCKVGYRSKYLTFKPDLVTRTWIVSGSDPAFARRFSKQFGVRMTNALEDTAKAIAEYFGAHYRSLGEEIVGNGVLILDGINVKSTTLIERIRNNQKSFLNGRR